MHDVDRALNEVKELYLKVVGQPAPGLERGSFVPFPPGVDPVRHAVDEVEQLKRFSQQAVAAPKPTAWVPPADCYATPDGLLIRLEVPGIAREDLKVLVAGDECIVRGERNRPDHTTELRPMALERPWGPFERRFTLPRGIRPDSVEAHYTDGLLELRMEGEAAGIPGEMTVEVA